MERKLRNATSKLRNLKDFLSSGSSSSSHHHHHQKNSGNRKSSHGSNSASGDRSRPNMSVSLFDLVDPPLSPSRPNSMAFPGHATGFPGYSQPHPGSVSMYGLAGAVSSGSVGDGGFGEQVRQVPPADNRPAVLPSKNPALRFFHTIRSKFRRRKRDRLNKIEDSKSTNDFGPFMSVAKYPTDNSNSAICDHPSSGASTRYQLETPRVPFSQSVNHLDYFGEYDNSFASPLGSRDLNYEMEKENSALNLTTFINSSSVIQKTTTSAPSVPIASAGSSGSSPAGKFSSSSDANPLQIEDGEGTASASGSDDPCSSSSAVLSKSTSVSTPTTSEPKLKGLAKELFDLIHFGWYWGGLSKEDAEEKLKDEPDGAFIVRDSSSSLYLLTLSFNSNGKTKHTRIEYVDGKFSFMSSETESFPSVAELIEHWIQNTEKGILCYSKSARTNAATSYPVRLTKPISRYTEVKSLRFLSSFVIYQYTRLDLIPKLPLPPPLINFIGQQRFLGN